VDPRCLEDTVLPPLVSAGPRSRGVVAHWLHEVNGAVRGESEQQLDDSGLRAALRSRLSGSAGLCVCRPCSACYFP